MKQLQKLSIISVMLATVLCNISLNNTVTAAGYYVALSGNDRNDGSLSSPWRSIEYAWRNSEGGDTVFVRGGIYSDDQIWLAAGRQGAENKNSFWTLMNYSDEKCVFENTRFIIDDSFVRIQGLHLTGTAFIQAVSWGGLHERIELIDNDISGSTNIPIYFNCNKGLVQGNTIHPDHATHGIYVMHGDGNVIRDNYISGINKYGIHIYDEKKYDHPTRITNLVVENNTVIGSKSRSGIIISAGESIDYSIEIMGVLLRNNTIINHAEDGITIRYYGLVRDVDIINNTISGNGNAGLAVSSENVDNLTVKNNIFYSNNKHLKITSTLSTFSVSHNLFWRPASVGSGIRDQHPVYQNPLFIDGEHGNFLLRKNSPAIDSGIEVGIPYQGEAPDLGAFEYDWSADLMKK